MKTSKCKCDLRTKLVGDGCAVCNPEGAKAYAEGEAMAKKTFGSLAEQFAIDKAQLREVGLKSMAKMAKDAKPKQVGNKAFRQAWDKATEGHYDDWNVQCAYDYEGWAIWQAAIRYERKRVKVAK